MSRYFFVFFALMISGCAQLTHGYKADAPNALNAKAGQYAVECNGVANNLGVCYSAAKLQCPHGYTLDQKEESTSGLMRSIVFTCN